MRKKRAVRWWRFTPAVVLPAVRDDSRYYNPCQGGHSKDQFEYEGENLCRRCGRKVDRWSRIEQ